MGNKSNKTNSMIGDKQFNEDPYFMDKVFKELEAKKGGEYPKIPSDTSFQGFTTIPIQKL